MSEISTLKAEVARLTAEVEEARRERDGWRQEHENLLGVRLADLTALDAKNTRLRGLLLLGMHLAHETLLGRDGVVFVGRAPWLKLPAALLNSPEGRSVGDYMEACIAALRTSDKPGVK